jgi:hypothetical protein
MARDDRPTGDDVVEDVMSAPGPPRSAGTGGSTAAAGCRATSTTTRWPSGPSRSASSWGWTTYDPDEVPPATDDPVPTDITESEQYQEELTEVEVETAKGVLPSGGQRPEFPPTRYPDN